jgi:hypothetical protein
MKCEHQLPDSMGVGINAFVCLREAPVGFNMKPAGLRIDECATEG